MNKQRGSLLTVYAILFAVFNVLFFVIPFKRTGAVWASFVFTEIAILLSCGITYFAFSKDGVRSAVYGFPIFRVSYIYLGLQFFFMLLFAIVNLSTETKVWISVVIGVLLLAFALVGVIAMDNARDIVESTDKKVTDKIKTIKTFKLDISSLAAKCEDKEQAKALEKLAEKLRYSDPVSSEATATAEQRLKDKIAAIENALPTGGDTLAKLIEEADKLIDERNRICKENK